MKILHIFDHSIPLHSGYTFRSMNILRHQRALGWETQHVTSPKQGAAASEEEIDGFLFHRSGIVPHLLRAVPVLAEFAVMARLGGAIDRLVRDAKPDILHVHSPVLNALPALLLGRRHRVPVVYEVRAFWEDAAVDHGTSTEGGLRYRLTRAVETFALKRADHITVICGGLKTDILARGIPEEKVTVIPNAVDVPKFAPIEEADAELAARLGVRDKKVLGFLGSFYAYEGLLHLVEAMPAILESVPEARLLLVGGGPQEAEIRAKVRELALDDAVIMPGRVPHDEIRGYYSLFDLLVYPRLSMRLTELVTPLKPLEAMALKKTLIASDVGGHRELIRDGETGALFRSGDWDALAEAAIDLLNNSVKLADMTEAARVFIENERNWPKVVEGYRAAYNSALKNRRIREG